MEISWGEARGEGFIKALTSAECRHVGFLVGSIVSCDKPSACMSVNEMRRGDGVAGVQLSLLTFSPCGPCASSAALPRNLLDQHPHISDVVARVVGGPSLPLVRQRVEE